MEKRGKNSVVGDAKLNKWGVLKTEGLNKKEWE